VSQAVAAGTDAGKAAGGISGKGIHVFVLLSWKYPKKVQLLSLIYKCRRTGAAEACLVLLHLVYFP